MDKKGFWSAVLIASVAKLLLMKAYRSTDFEVHRNWMAITHSLPLERWYYEQTSEWTLDYPPFFAYFEWILSKGARFFDENMLKVDNLNYASNMTVFYQKLTVVLTDFVLAFAVLEWSQAMDMIIPKSRKKYQTYLMTLFGLIFLNGGIFMVDHIHFQYNGFLFGVLLLALVKISKGNYYQGALIFASLLSLKHIFLYVAPAVGVYLLRTQCVKTDARGVPNSINVMPLLTLGGIVVSVLTLAFGPFYKHIPQIVLRLFPFKRGLSHAYWAPNVWTAYNSLDLILNYGLKLGKSGATSGLVGESSLAVLPQVQPIHTFVITFICMLPILWKLWKLPTPTSFIYAITLTAWTSFMFGYHVHEKAILNVLVPFALIAILNPNIFALTLAAGTVSLFPLLFTPFEIVFKAVIAVFHLCLSYKVLDTSFKLHEIVYIAGFVPVYIFENLGYIFVPKLPFLPLLVVSNYTLIGILYCYISLYWTFLNIQSTKVSDKPIISSQSTKPFNISPRVLRKRK